MCDVIQDGLSMHEGEKDLHSDLSLEQPVTSEPVRTAMT